MNSNIQFIKYIYGFFKINTAMLVVVGRYFNYFNLRKSNNLVATVLLV